MGSLRSLRKEKELQPILPTQPSRKRRNPPKFLIEMIDCRGDKRLEEFKEGMIRDLRNLWEMP